MGGGLSYPEHNTWMQQTEQPVTENPFDNQAAVSGQSRNNINPYDDTVEAMMYFGTPANAPGLSEYHE